MKVTCPKCGSDQIASSKKGFSGKKAVAGAVLTGGIGILAGTIGSNNVKCTCLACGNTFPAGKGKVIYEPGEAPAQPVKKQLSAKQLRTNKIALAVIGIAILLIILASIFANK